MIARVDWDSPSNTGFLLLPDLNWDRKTVEGMHEVDLHYFLGEENGLWKKCFGRLKKGEVVDLNV